MTSTTTPPANTLLDEHAQESSTYRGSAAVSASTLPGPSAGLLMTVEQVAVLWFGEVGEHGSASANCQKIRRLIPDVLPARRIGNRWYVNRAAAEKWAAESDPTSVMVHPDTRRVAEGRSIAGVAR
jgi:hypothetical protein